MELPWLNENKNYITAGLAVSIWTGAWHIARHINLRRAIKKRRKFHSETKIQSLAILSCTTEYRVLFAFVPFSGAILVVYEGGLENQARDFILLRQTRRALKGAPRQVKARAEACARDRAPQTARPVTVDESWLHVARVCLRVFSTLVSWSNDSNSCMRVDDIWQARVCMRVFSTLTSLSNENKSCMRIDESWQARVCMETLMF